MSFALVENNQRFIKEFCKYKFMNYLKIILCLYNRKEKRISNDVNHFIKSLTRTPSTTIGINP